MDNPAQVSTGTQIQGTNIRLERSHPPIGRMIKVYDDRLKRMKGHEIVTVIAKEDGVILQVCSMPWWGVVEANLVVGSLQQAATIAADFETWWTNT